MAEFLKGLNVYNIVYDLIPNLKRVIDMLQTVKEITSMCDKLEKDGHTKYGLFIALESCFTHGNVDLTLDLLRALKNKQEPIRNHYFWPAMATLGKTGRTERKQIANCSFTLVSMYTLHVSLQYVHKVSD